MRFFSVVAVAIAIAGATPPVVASVFKDFEQVWADRDAQYTAQKSAIDARVAETNKKLVDALKAGNQDVRAELAAVFSAEHDIGELTGRGMMLQELRENMERKPSAAIANAWLQGKVDELQTLKRKVDDQLERLKQGGPNLTPTDHLVAFEQYAIDAGHLQGRVEELTLINQNLSTVYVAKAEADQRRAAALRAFGAALSAAGQNTNQQQFHNTTCMGMGPNMLSCTGN
jgi:hypothetical protein